MVNNGELTAVIYDGDCTAAPSLRRMELGCTPCFILSPRFPAVCLSGLALSLRLAGLTRAPSGHQLGCLFPNTWVLITNVPSSGRPPDPQSPLSHPSSPSIFCGARQTS